MKRKPHRPFDYMAPSLSAYERPPEPQPLVDAEPDHDLDIAQGPTRQPPHLQVHIAEAVEQTVAHRAPSEPAPRPADAAPQWRPAPKPPKRDDRMVYALGAVVALFAALAPAAFWVGALSKSGPFQFEPFTFAVLGAIGLALGVLAFASIYVLRQGLHLAREARFARRQAEDMLQPALLAAAGAGSAVEAVRQEIDAATAAAAQARHELKTLSEVMAAETAKLMDAAGQSSRSATALTASFAHEREGLTDLSTSLDKQVVQVTDTIGRQARMVAEASDLAEAQIREAEAALAARAADLVAAAGQTTDAARLASEDLARQTLRLETAGTAVTDQIQSLEQGLAEQRAALVATSHALRADQEDFAAQIETQQAQLSELLAEARADVRSLNETTADSGETMRRLVEDASDQVQQLAKAVETERENFSASALHTVGALADAVRKESETLEVQTREAVEAMAKAAADAHAAAAAQADAARNRVDELSEAAFAAGQKADAAFEARLNEAQALIAQSANLVDDAGKKAAERMAASLASARQAADEFRTLLEEVEQRTARLPLETQERSAEVKAVLDQGVDELMSVARKASEETQAIDAAFQERVRRNYEMLSEAVRLMGVVSGAQPAARPLRHAARPEPEAAAALPPLRSARPPADDAEDLGLRPRLKLTPTAADEAVSSLFEPEPDRAPSVETSAEGDDWSWKDMLSSIDAAPGGPDRLGEKMTDEIDALGIDPAALMPSGRIDQIAAAMQGGDRAAAREIVRRVAPAAVRRLSRRVMTDIALRSQADRYLQRYEARLTAAGQSPQPVEALAEVLNDDQGRAFLLIDTAVGGLA